MTEFGTVIAHGRKGGGGEGRVLADKRRKKHFGVMEMFYILLGLVIAWVIHLSKLI